jgi:CubicO group peptidase (beta-lactamase class C family)
LCVAKAINSHFPKSRHLLSHTSGISHPCWNPLLYRYLTSLSRPTALSSTGRIERTCLYPLVFEPGTSWEYGAGLDWAGKIVERVNGNMPLQDYMQQHIWTPLNMTTATFRLHERPDLAAEVPEMMCRQGLNHPIYGTTMSPFGRLVPYNDPASSSSSSSEIPHAIIEELPDDHPDTFNPSQEPDDDSGSTGIYCSAPDFAKLLASLCANDGKLLKRETVDEMFRPQLSEAAQVRLQELFATEEIRNIFTGGLPLTTPPLPLDFGLGGMLVLEDVPSGLHPHSHSSASDGIAGLGKGMKGTRSNGGRRRRGTMFWSGLPNLYWWIDRAAGVSGFWASQLLPQGDPRSLEFFGRWEEEVYARVGGKAVAPG